MSTSFVYGSRNQQESPEQSRLSPGDAINQDTAPRPPHVESPQQSAVDFDQAVRGVHSYYDKFRQAEHAYESLSRVLAGEQEPPIVSFPTGGVDENGRPIVFEIDLKLTIPDRLTEEERLHVLKIQLEPMLNHASREYIKWITRLADYADLVRQMLIPVTAPEAPAKTVRSSPRPMKQSAVLPGPPVPLPPPPPMPPRQS